MVHKKNINNKAVLIFFISMAFVTFYHISFFEIWTIISMMRHYEDAKGKNRYDDYFNQVLANFTSPEESLDPSSEYFGVIYKDIYGFSILEKTGTDFSYAAFIKNLPHWLSFFPKLKENFNAFQKFNPTRDATLFTNSFSISAMKSEIYNVGDIFEARIQAKDGLKRRKTFGGDYFRARLLDEHEGNASGIPCMIEDHMDGTYTIKAPLLFEGMFWLDVVLVQTLEGVYRLSEWSAGRIYQSELYHARLRSNEKVLCSNDLVLYERFKDSKKLCDYSNPRNGEPWFCEVRLSNYCSPIIQMKTERIRLYHLPFDISYEMEQQYKTYQRIHGQNIKAQVISQENDLRIETGNSSDARVKVQQAMHLKNFLRLSGYSRKGVWMPLVRNYKHSTIHNYRHCFKNKVVYMLGDSTIRQFYFLAEDYLNLYTKSSEKSKIWSRPLVGRNFANNITIYYRGHGPPFRNPGPPRTRPYISDSIDEIKAGGKNVFIMIGIGLHLLEYDSAFFIHRLKGIRTSLVKYLHKFSESRVVIKGLNVTKYQNRPFEWLIYRYHVLLRETFAGLKNVAYVDFWDMTTLWPLTDDNHPPSLVLSQQALILFSYLCD